MANPNAPRGFVPFRHASGGASARTNEYTLSTAYNTALYLGDMVKTDGSGNLNICSAGNQAVGVVAGFKYILPDGSVQFKRNWIASQTTLSGTIIRAEVWDDPNQLFVAQAVASMTAADEGEWANIDVSTAGNALTGISGMQVSAESSTGALKIVRVLTAARDQYPCRNAAGNPDFYDTGTNAQVVVKIIKHELGAVATVEVT